MTHQSADSPAENHSAPTFDTVVYVQQSTQLLQLSIPPEQMAGVVENFERVQTIAQPVLDFPLPDTLEALPTFEP
ncbi:MAG: DUF4089 domain-containing protein [Leptolyngbyaceae cyanobacterium]